MTHPGEAPQDPPRVADVRRANNRRAARSRVSARRCPPRARTAHRGWRRNGRRTRSETSRGILAVLLHSGLPPEQPSDDGAKELARRAATVARAFGGGSPHQWATARPCRSIVPSARGIASRTIVDSLSNRAASASDFTKAIVTGVESKRAERFPPDASVATRSMMSSPLLEVLTSCAPWAERDSAASSRAAECGAHAST